MDGAGRQGVSLYWLPLGAGGRVVRRCGVLYETLAARLAGRQRADLYHSALEVSVDGCRYVVEQTPVPGGSGHVRGVVAVGGVVSRRAARLRVFRYEVRRWRDGTIPDVAWAVDSPRIVTVDRERARRLLGLVPFVPTPLWGRDELGAGEMWNSNSIVAWLLERAGLDAAGIVPPAGGRAPGWRAGVRVAQRSRG